jgi:hypothetical protein
MDSAIWGLIGTIVGALASILTTLLINWNSRWLQKDAKRFDREEKRKEFQIENLIKLQEAAMASMRLAARVHLEDTKYFRVNPEEINPGPLPEELSNEMMLSIQKLNLLTERVDDDELRENLRSLRDRICEVHRSTSETHSQSLLSNASELFNSVQQEIGALLRRN